MSNICKKHNLTSYPSKEQEKLGIALDTIGKLPINGMRVKDENGTCGWYIWCGEEYKEDADFFSPLCVEHIENYLPDIKEYLDLPLGYRFLLAPNYEDIWKDRGLLDVAR